MKTGHPGPRLPPSSAGSRWRRTSANSGAARPRWDAMRSRWPLLPGRGQGRGRARLRSPLRRRGWSSGRHRLATHQIVAPASAGMVRRQHSNSTAPIRRPRPRACVCSRARGMVLNAWHHAAATTGSSPCLRGWSPCSTHERLMAHVAPAPAGMARSGRRRGRCRCGRLRACGDGPDGGLPSMGLDPSSTRLRGWPVVSMACGVAESPRAREGPHTAVAQYFNARSPPRPRGWSGGRATGQRRVRVVPVSAGMVRASSPSSPAKSSRPLRLRGWSPRMRGPELCSWSPVRIVLGIVHQAVRGTRPVVRPSVSSTWPSFFAALRWTMRSSTTRSGSRCVTVFSN